MQRGDKGLQIIGVEHVATKNSLTVRARIYVQRFDGRVYSFDADCSVWELARTEQVDNALVHKITGVAQ